MTSITGASTISVKVTSRATYTTSEEYYTRTSTTVDISARTPDIATITTTVIISTTSADSIILTPTIANTNFPTIAVPTLVLSMAMRRSTVLQLLF